MTGIRKIAVCLKEVVDARLPLQVVSASGEIVPAGGAGKELELVRLINPADRTALETAIQIRERSAGQGPEIGIDAFSVAKAASESALHYALARGADQAERLEPEKEGAPYTALTLARRILGRGYDLVLCGDETLDNSCAAVGPLLAELLHLPVATTVCRIREIRRGNGIMHAALERRMGRGYRQVVSIRLPALLTVTEDAAPAKYVSAARLRAASGIKIGVWEPPSDQGAEDTLGDGAGVGLRWAQDEKRVPPRARVKKKFRLDPGLSASDRVKMIMSGGMSEGSNPARTSSVLEGDLDYLSEQIFRFLKHHEFI